MAQATGDSSKAVVYGGVSVGHAGDAGTEDGRVVGGGDGHLQGLGGAAGAVAHTHTEDLAGIGLQGFNGGIVRYVHISAVAAVQVQRAIAAGQAGGVGDAADALAATGLTGHAVGQHGVVVCVASCKRARDIGKSIVGTGVAQGDGGRCSQGRPIVGAGDGDGDGGVVAQSRAAGVCGADGVGQHQGFAGGQVVKVLGTAVESPAHTGRGAAGVAEQAGGGQAQHGQKIGVAGVGGCRGAANGQRFAYVHSIAQVVVCHRQGTAAGQCCVRFGDGHAVVAIADDRRVTGADDPGRKAGGGAGRAIADHKNKIVLAQGASRLTLDGRIVGHKRVGPCAAVEVERAKRADPLLVVIDTANGVVLCNAVLDAVAQAAGGVTVGAIQGAGDGRKVVVARQIDVAGAGLAGAQLRRVIGRHDADGQHLAGAGVAGVGDLEREALAGVGGQCIDDALVRHVFVSAGAAVEVERTVTASELAVVAAAAAVCCIACGAVGGGVIAIPIRTGQRAAEGAEGIVASRVGDRDRREGRQARPVVAAGQGELYRRGDLLALRIGDQHRVAERDRFACAQEIQIAGRMAVGPAHGTGDRYIVR